MTEGSDLNLLMVHADDHAPVLDEGLPEASARDQGDTRPPSVTDRLWDEGGDPNDLTLQRWGILAPEGAHGDRLLALVEPLMAARRDQQGAPVKVYRVPPGLTPEAAARWHKKAFDARSDLGVDTPRFQMILGDLDHVSLGVQQVQSSGGFVGRVAFADDAGYEAYVDKVLRWERRPAPQPLGRALFFTVHDGSAAIRTGHRSLVVPGLEIVRRSQLAGEFPAREVVALGESVDTTPDELLDGAAAPEPGVLFSVSHGEGAPRGGWSSPEEQRRRQGAMSFGREGRLVGEDLRDRVFMPGGVWFMLACYGAGTPSTSGYDHWLARLRAAGQLRGDVSAVLAGLPRDQRPFVAALPQAALSNPNGPLAFIGHVDLAWTYSFMDLDSGAAPRPARFMRLMRALSKRDRVGVAMRELSRYFEQTNTELTSLVDEQAQATALGLDYQVDVARQGHLWMLRQDLAGYVALGDPAVRLATAAPVGSAVADSSPSIEVRTVVDSPTTLAELDQLEEAIAHVMLGDVALLTLADGLGRTRGELERLAMDYRAAGRKTLIGE